MNSAKKVTDEDAWFTKANLNTSSPWNLQKLKDGDYSFFSPAGVSGSRFYMRLRAGGTCDTAEGYFRVVEAVVCPSYGATPYTASYHWMPDTNQRSYLKDRQLSLEFALFGDFIDPVRWYQRL